MAVATATNDLDGDKRHRMFRREEGHQHFGFDFKVLRIQRQAGPGFQVDETKAALRVGQMPTDVPGQLAAHEAVHLPAQPGNGVRLVHAVAYHQQRPGFFGASQKAGQIIRHMLAVTVEGHYPCKTLASRLRQPAAERRALAEVSLVADHHGARVTGQGGGVIRRTVVHDNHQGEISTQSGNQGGDAGVFIETGDHRGTCYRFRHAFNLAPIPPGIEAKSP